MPDKIEQLRQEAALAKMSYNKGLISKKEAELIIQPYLDEVNKKSKELATKYGVKHRDVKFSYYMR